MKNFKNLKIWQKSMEIVKDVYLFVADFPKQETYSLGNQLTRAAVSISSNIAEGSSRNSDKDYARFIEMALGSGFEVETQVLVALHLNLGKQVIGNKILILLDEQQKMLIRFLSVLRKGSKLTAQGS
ncbi:MAG: four helix bundle protein [Chitinophagaceae bacterium]|nr:four helix bundle protein [Chitinophagaceae bacterium]